MVKSQKVPKDQDPAYKPYDRDEIKKRKKNLYGKLNSFAWSTNEEILYVEFLKINTNLFIDLKQRKKNNVFVAMSNFIKKRGSDQCRSHHQKMSIKYGSIEEIIRNLTVKKLMKAELYKKQEKLPFETIQIEQNEKGQTSSEVEIKTNQEQKFQNFGVEMNFTIQSEQIWDLLDENVWND